MNRVLIALTIITLAGSATPCTAQSMGTMTENGVSMGVVYAVALFDAERPSLEFVLLPFDPTEEEVAELRAGGIALLSLLEKESPDTKKWPSWSPYGEFSLSWAFEPAAVGDPTKAWISIYGGWIGAQNSNLNVNRMPGDLAASLEGTVKEGETVTLTSEGSDADMGFAWDLEVQAKVLTKGQR